MKSLIGKYPPFWNCGHLQYEKLRIVFNIVRQLCIFFLNSEAWSGRVGCKICEFPTCRTEKKSRESGEEAIVFPRERAWRLVSG